MNHVKLKKNYNIYLQSNISDQRTLEFNIYSINKSIKVRRKIYDRVLDKVKTDENGKLFV